MEFLRIDLPAIIAIIFGGMMLLIPIVGLTARVAVPPIIDAVARAWTPQSSSRALMSVEARLARLERRIEELVVEVHRRDDEPQPERVVASFGA
ncbi:MAG: hypothetical protein M3418_12330 [Gemmatimonadota bacterium]|nr:hypothetical protein [Gemmatimonadota bacterium]